MKKYISIVISLVILACVGDAVAGDRPNIILIFTDDQGYQDLGCFGSKTIKTPHLDRMATEGVRLTSFYAQSVCGVSRAALMTGSYPIRVAEPGNVKRLHTVPSIQLFNLTKDPGEATDVAAANPKVVAALMKRIERARKELGDIGQVGSGARMFDDGPRKLQVPVKPRRK